MIVRWLMLGMACAGAAVAQPPIQVKIHASDGPAQHIPRTLFGTFLEPIGNATYNGLWAEILQNPSFESGLWSVSSVREMTIENPELARSSQMGLPIPWKSLHPDQAKRYEPRRGDAANSFESVAIFGLPAEETGVRQAIYLPVHRELHYRGSLFVKHLSGGDLVRVWLRSRDRQNHTLAQAEFHTPD